MGDVTIAQDLADALVDMAGEIGDDQDCLVIGQSVGTWIDPNDKSKGKQITPIEDPAIITFYDFESSVIDGSTVKVGDKQGVVSQNYLSQTNLKNYNKIQQGVGNVFQIINVEELEIAGALGGGIFHLRK